MHSLLADLIVLAHFLFIVFVICGGLLVIRWPKVAFIHLPAATWGAIVEFFGWICPLTPLENHFRNLAGHTQYSGDFILRYLVPVIYPDTLTSTIQTVLGIAVIVINVFVYTIAIRKHKNTASR
ncbi:putative membrane protein [hydrocarbon metagenome]|uniref:Putative membrane protein n=1 Tax=hydrocarbon metagenome TaxID=938273 RepID=A0A0W8FLW5_9ZZZZ